MVSPTALYRSDDCPQKIYAFFRPNSDVRGKRLRGVCDFVTKWRAARYMGKNGESSHMRRILMMTAMGAAGSLLAACGPVGAARGNSSQTKAIPRRYGLVTAKAPSLPPFDSGSAALSEVSASTVAAILNGQLVMTRNGGQSWFTEALPAGTSPNALDFVSPTTGWLIAWTGGTLSHPAIYKTTDGGHTWHQQFNAPPAVYGGALDMLSAQDGWAIVSTGLYRTTDGGDHWTAVPLPSGLIPVHLDFTSGTYGWVAARAQSGTSQGTVLATAGGKKFRTILTLSRSIGAITLKPDGTGNVLENAPDGEAGVGPVIHTADDGQSWTTLTSADALAKGQAFGYPGGMAFSGKTGWIGTNNGAQGFTPNGLMVTGNGGVSWHDVGGNLGWAIQDVSMTAPGTGWIVANGTSGSDFLAHTGDNGARWTVAWPPRSPVSVDFVSPTSGYGMGLPDNANAIMATQDAGRHWSIQTALPPELFTADAFSPTLGLGVYATYDTNNSTPVTKIYASTDSGKAWRLLDTASGVSASSITYLGAKTWAMSVQHNLTPVNQVLISTDNGRHWTPTGLTVPDGSAMSVVSRHEAWVFASSPKNSPSTPGRLTLDSLSGAVRKTVLTLPSNGPVRYFVSAVDFVNNQDGWVSVNKYVASDKLVHKPGDQKLVHAAGITTNLLYYTTDGGQHWTVWQLPALWTVGQLDLVTSQMGYIEVNGTVVMTKDGGGVWTVAP